MPARDDALTLAQLADLAEEFLEELGAHRLISEDLNRLAYARVAAARKGNAAALERLLQETAPLVEVEASALGDVVTSAPGYWQDLSRELALYRAAHSGAGGALAALGAAALGGYLWWRRRRQKG